MIFDNIANIGNYKDLTTIYKSLEWLKELTKEETREKLIKYPEKTGGFSAVLLDYTTKQEDQCVFESHKKFIDVHFMISSREIIKVQREESLTLKTQYSEQEDCTLLCGKSGADILMTEGSFMVLYPSEAHMVGVSVNNQNQQIEKIVLKIHF